MKGSIADILLIFIYLTVLTIAFFAGTKIYDTWSIASNKTLANYGEDVQNKTATASHGIDLSFTALNLGIPVIIFGILLGALIFVYFVPTHPSFIPAAIVLLIIFGVMAVLFSNVLQGFITDTPITDVASDNPIVVGIIQYLPHIVILSGILILVVMYARPGEQE